MHPSRLTVVRYRPGCFWCYIIPSRIVVCYPRVDPVTISIITATVGRPASLPTDFQLWKSGCYHRVQGSPLSPSKLEGVDIPRTINTRLAGAPPLFANSEQPTLLRLHHEKYHKMCLIVPYIVVYRITCMLIIYSARFFVSMLS